MAQDWDEILAWYAEALLIEKDKLRLQAQMAGATLKE